MPRYNFLDEAGLKQYHKLAGYSSIPITAITNYTSGDLDLGTGVVTPSTSYMVTDYIVLQQNKKYAILNLSTSRSVICYYKADNTFVFGEVFDSKISFTLQDKTKNGVTPAKIRVSSKGQIFIQALHQNTITWLCNDILENRSDIATNRNDIAETNKLIMRLHADYNISVTPITIEKGVSNKITISNVYFKFDGNKIYPSGGYEIKRSGAAGNLPLFDGGDGSDILNNSGYLNDTISKSATYTLSMTHLGCPFTKAVSVSAYYPIIYGGLSEPSIDKDMLDLFIKSNSVFSKTAKASPAGTYTFNTNKDDYMYFLVPRDEESDGRYNMTISEVKSSGFGVPMESPVLVTCDSGRQYNVYRSQIQVNAGQKTLVVTGSRTTIS